MRTFPPLNRTHWGSGTFSLLMVPPVWTQCSLLQKSRRTSGDSPPLTHGPLRQPTLKSHLLDEMKMGCDRLTDGESATRCARVSVELPSSTSSPSRASVLSSPPKTSGQGPAATSMLPQPAAQAQGTPLRTAGYWRLTKKSITLTLNFCLRTQKVCYFFLVLYVNNINIFQEEILDSRNLLVCKF